jgi:NTE family protein
MHVVRLLAPRLDNENHTKDIDFGPSGIRKRRHAGYTASMRALDEAAWQGEFDPVEGVKPERFEGGRVMRRAVSRQ